MTKSVSALLERAQRCELLAVPEIKWICEAAREIFAREENIVNISTPVTVAGDIHGQFDDLLRLFQTGGELGDTSYVFLGDYVDRGRHSVQVISLLFLLKIKYPEQITLLRGNHEARSQTQVFGFYDECLVKYGDPRAWTLITDTFDFMPVAALVDNRLFCCHGGLSPSARDLDTIRGQKRTQELPHSGVLADLAWSDPEDEHTGWRDSPRGAGYTFGQDVTEEWNENNGLDLLVRAHQMVDAGFYWLHAKQALSLFSAPNYMYRCGNTAALLHLQPGLQSLHFKQFVASRHQDSHCQPPPTAPAEYFV